MRIVRIKITLFLINLIAIILGELPMIIRDIIQLNDKHI